jgi:hypothetical protein
MMTVSLTLVMHPLQILHLILSGWDVFSPIQRRKG